MAIYEDIATDGPRRKLRIKSPVTLEPIGEIECGTRSDVEAAVERARKAQVDWAATPIDERAKLMWKLLDLYVDAQDEIIDAVIEETGKARTEAIGMEVFSGCDSISYYAKNAKKFLAPEKRKIHGLMGFAKKLKVVFKPLGVVGLITPWNGPVVLSVNPLVQAVMAGNAVVHKPSEVTPFSARIVERLFREAGFRPASSTSGMVTAPRAPRGSSPASTRSRSRAAWRRGARSARPAGGC